VQASPLESKSSIFLIILQNYTTVSKFISYDIQPPGPWCLMAQQPWVTAVEPTAVGPHGREGQPPWPTAVGAYSSCATMAGPTAVAHDGKGCAATVAYGGRSPFLYKSQKLAWKCHKNSEKKEREVWEGEESEGRSSEALPVLRFIGKYFVDFNPFST
jgi:hypothetical protein